MLERQSDPSNQLPWQRAMREGGREVGVVVVESEEEAARGVVGRRGLGCGSSYNAEARGEGWKRSAFSQQENKCVCVCVSARKFEQWMRLRKMKNKYLHRHIYGLNMSVLMWLLGS